MKKFIAMILCVSTFFIGLGSMVESVGARFKSDERALNLIKQARAAIGGDANIASVRSLTAKGKIIHITQFDGAEKSIEGETEINLALPNKFSRVIRIGKENLLTDGTRVSVNEDKKVFLIKKGEGDVHFNIGENEGENFVEGDGKVRKEIRIMKRDGEEMRAGKNPQHHDFTRTMLSLFLAAPEGTDITLLYVGSGNVDGTACEIVEAKTGNDSIAKLYLSKSSSLPVMMSYNGMEIPRVIHIKNDGAAAGEGDRKMFIQKLEKPEMSEISVKFSDHRNAGGIVLPHIWTKSVNGKISETVRIENFDFNPANIEEKFNKAPQRVMIQR